MFLTNKTSGPKGIWTKAGIVTVEPGQTVEVDVEKADLDIAKGAGYFDVKAKAPAPVATPTKQPDGKFSVVRGDEVLVTDLADEDAAKAWIADPANKA